MTNSIDMSSHPEREIPGVAHTPSQKHRRYVGGPEVGALRLRLKTITPVLGGSSAPRSVDGFDPIRAPSIRGHLRFWWRALHGHAYTAPAELARRERELWGGVGSRGATRSSVELCVRMESDLREQEPDTSEIPQTSKAAYALWVANSQTTTGQNPSPRWPPSVCFVLQVRAPVDWLPEVEVALRGWILWGGYGSRTRRGLGSLTVLDEVARWLPSRPTREEWSRLFPGLPLLGPPPARALQMPGLQGARLLYGPSGDKPGEAWESALGWLRDFRQRQDPFHQGERRSALRATGERPGELAREFRKGRPGRSYWPEADKVRQLIPHPKGTSWAHTPRPQHRSRTPAWPRASFGLPLPIRFQKRARSEVRGQQGEYYPAGEPPEVELQWHDGTRSHDRLASPLIVKAMPLADGRFVPIALWLRRAWPDTGRVVLMKKRVLVRGSEAPFDRLRAPEDESLYAPLLKTNIEEAFLMWVKGFRGVEEST